MILLSLRRLLREAELLPAWRALSLRFSIDFSISFIFRSLPCVEYAPTHVLEPRFYSLLLCCLALAQVASGRWRTAALEHRRARCRW